MRLGAGAITLDARVMRLVAGVTLAIGIIPAAAGAGIIEGACMSLNRTDANRGVCSCIQAVADMTLTGRDQKRAAGFFRDPDAAQAVRMSRSDADNAFWARYQMFGDMAAHSCGQ